jgi:hypothetical protein
MSRRKGRTRKSIVERQTHSDIELRMLALLELKRRRLLRELDEVVGQYQQLSLEIELQDISIPWLNNAKSREPLSDDGYGAVPENHVGRASRRWAGGTTGVTRGVGSGRCSGVADGARKDLLASIIFAETWPNSGRVNWYARNAEGAQFPSADAVTVPA